MLCYAMLCYAMQKKTNYPKRIRILSKSLHVITTQLPCCFYRYPPLQGTCHLRQGRMVAQHFDAVGNGKWARKSLQILSCCNQWWVHQGKSINELKLPNDSGSVDGLTRGSKTASIKRTSNQHCRSGAGQRSSALRTWWKQKKWRVFVHLKVGLLWNCFQMVGQYFVRWRL